MTGRAAVIALAVLLVAARALTAQVSDGNRAWTAGRYDEARTAYERALKDDPRSVRSLYRLAVLAAWGNRLDSALVLLRRARAVEPRDPDVRTTQAQVYAWQGHHAAALALYDSVLADLPARRDARLGRARTLGWAGRFDAADSAYAALLRDNPADMDALVGRAQAAHWAGHDRAARAGLALVTDSGSREARTLTEELDAARGPQAEAAINWNNDSDHNTNWSEALTLSTGIASGARVFATGGTQQGSDPLRHATRDLAEAGVSLDAGRAHLTIAAGARRLHPDAAPDRTAATWRAGASIRATQRVSVGVTYAHFSFDETALLIGAGLDVDAADASLDLTLARGTTLGLGGGAAWISDGNHRISAALALSRDVGSHFFIGAFARLLDYSAPGAGYFAPDRFVLAEGRAGFTVATRQWRARLSGGAGVQQTSGSAAQAEWHADVRAGRRWGAVNAVELFGSVTNSVASSVSGAFRYRTAGLRIVLSL